MIRGGLLGWSFFFWGGEKKKRKKTKRKKTKEKETKKKKKAKKEKEKEEQSQKLVLMKPISDDERRLVVMGKRILIEISPFHSHFQCSMCEYALTADALRNASATSSAPWFRIDCAKHLYTRHNVICPTICFPCRKPNCETGECGSVALWDKTRSF